LLPRLRHIARTHDLVNLFRDEIYRLEDYLFVQRDQAQPVGLIWFHYYYKYRYVFVSYVILARPSAARVGRSYLRSSLELLVMRGLFQSIVTQHPDCRGVLMEVDAGEKERLDAANDVLTSKLRDPATLRGRGLERLLKRRFEGIRRVDAPYVQPESPTHDERREMPLWLLWFPVNVSSRDSARDWLPRSTYATMLEFIYQGVYRDELDNLEGFDQDLYVRYCTYLRQLKARVLAKTPQRIPLV
jgi:hypothetical protein